MTNHETPRLTGIVKATGVCHCCGRKLGKVFELSNGFEYGRRCAAKITGYTVTDQAIRMAVFAAQQRIDRREAGWGVAEFTALGRDSCGIDHNDRMVYAPGMPHVSDWAADQARELWAD